MTMGTDAEIPAAARADNPGRTGACGTPIPRQDGAMSRRHISGMTNPEVGILMGSKNDFETLKPCCDVLDEFGIAWEAKVLSAHRTPDAALDYAKTAEERGLQVIICAAGGAAHLAGFIAAKSVLPILAVPIASTPLGGLDALLAMVQMPGGIPVGTLAIGKWGATNAGVLAVQIIGTKRNDLRDRMRAWRAKKADAILATTLP
jgi:5-(carboxyamino)imidazole ribonucleotide mutase